MAKQANSEPTAPEVVQLLVDVADADTVYRDFYLARARVLLGAVLPENQYRALEGIRRDLDEAVKRSKAAAMMQDWQRVDEFTRRAEELRLAADQKAAVAGLGEAVYDASPVAIDPFSPGFESLLKAGKSLGEVRDALVGKLAALSRADATIAGICEPRRAFFSGLNLPSRQAAAATATTATAAKGTPELERLAFDAAQRGDVGQLRRMAQEILARQEKSAAAPTERAGTATPAAAGRTSYRCPVDLSIPFADDVVRRAQALGLAVARTEAHPAAGPIIDFVAARMWQSDLSDPEVEREGTMKAEALVDETGLPPEARKPIKVLVGQFVRNSFINSGGARYLPPFAPEAVLIEDFPEDSEPPHDSELLSALGLAQRRALARLEIEKALLQHGAEILAKRLGLDAQEFRLVCIPPDLYRRFGLDRGWGQQQQWTHFDGYHVLKGGRLRALTGGDVRYGGLSDLVSIAVGDRREGVIARFAVIRRARQVVRWQ